MADRIDRRGRLVLELVVAMLWIGLPSIGCQFRLKSAAPRLPPRNPRCD
jgi:hypothetical protein